MTVDLEAIAQRGRCEISSLRIALPLLEQGFTPPYLTRYRRDELGGIDERSLWMLWKSVSDEAEIQRRRANLEDSWRSTPLADPSLEKAVAKAHSKRMLDRLSRRLKSELNESDNDSTRLAVRILNPQKGDGNDLPSIAAKVEGISDAGAAISGLDEKIAQRLCGDPRVINAAVRWLAKNSRIHISKVHDPHVSGKDDEQDQPKKRNRKNSAKANSESSKA
ncbi:MAG: Tex-like N-terminal domain-containing protein, partial [Planctomycetota bacterium]